MTYDSECPAHADEAGRDLATRLTRRAGRLHFPPGLLVLALLGLWACEAENPGGRGEAPEPPIFDSSTAPSLPSDAGAPPEMDARTVYDAQPDAAPEASTLPAPDAFTPIPTPMPECQGDGDCQAMLSAAIPAGCAVGRCQANECVFTTLDADGDRHGTSTCTVAGLALTLGDDCDDQNATRFGGAWDGPATDVAASACDEVDNDCNGSPDDGTQGGKTCLCDPAVDIDTACSLRADGSVVPWPAGSPLGTCRAGKRSCLAGAWGACVGVVEPASADLCNVADDDSNCNGVRSEGCECIAGATRPCGVDLGSCKPGVQACADGRWATQCVGAIEPASADTCAPGNDANCNGTPNDGCACIEGATSTCGQALPGAGGDCLTRVITCSNGAWPQETCAENCNDCPAGACPNGTCDDDVGDYHCTCNARFTPSPDMKSCVAVDPCAGVMCTAHATCNQGLCTCEPGFVPGAAGTCVDPCAGTNCAPGTCSGGTCMCPVTHMPSADSRACMPIPVDLCADASCTPGSCNAGNGRCTCPDTHMLRADGKACVLIPVNLCADASCTPGSCNAGNGRCTCPVTHMLRADGKACVLIPVDLCADASCAPGSCNPGNGRCTCPVTHMLRADGKACVPIPVDLCADASCAPGSCNAGNGRCTCPDTHMLRADGKACVLIPVNLCADASCAPGSCNAGNGRCTCPGTHMLRADGKACVPIPVNLCADASCAPGSCNAGNGRCTCPDTHMLRADGKACVLIPVDLCADASCAPGTCNAGNGRCTCPDTHMLRADGKACVLIPVDLCADASCAPGSCNAGNGRCTCPGTHMLRADGKACVLPPLEPCTERSLEADYCGGCSDCVDKGHNLSRPSPGTSTYLGCNRQGNTGLYCNVRWPGQNPRCGSDGAGNYFCTVCDSYTCQGGTCVEEDTAPPDYHCEGCPYGATPDGKECRPCPDEECAPGYCSPTESGFVCYCPDGSGGSGVTSCPAAASTMSTPALHIATPTVRK